jgi:hypothetical protein
MEMPSYHHGGFGWLAAAGARFRFRRLAKALGTTLAMTLFFIAYFWVLQHPPRPPFVMPLTAIDRWIAFWPGALPLYLSLWLYVSLVPALVVDRRELIALGSAWVVLSTVGLGIFYLFPTTVPPTDLDWSQHPSFQFLKSVDLSGNACPSLHVAFAVFSAVWFARLLRQLDAGRFARAFNWIWCAGILYSTIATRQHVSLDVLAGEVLGVVVAAAHLRWLRAQS